MIIVMNTKNMEKKTTQAHVDQLCPLDHRGKKHDALAKRHNIRVEALKKVLDAMSPENGSPMVLLCRGESSHCSILPIPISNSEDEVETWREIHRAWYARRGYWRKRLLGYSVTRVDAVNVCFQILSF
ncbi:uncharacterized protein AKAW2_50356S [Aspergillus luchuensis]|uniref:Uncharacterized protein n=1 Tax=Aspergillus kawachii TaxID=1069201 RepID=A0A7R7WC66_ASPKA|nr:uncharacterized protein AKAW2_50356S [Aspergillus luchuensis]BCS00015.1 hypothetical protein AKAW2_50356S [Aspergillus luchuensis]